MKNLVFKNTILTCLVTSLIPISAWATLGQDTQSVTTDAQTLTTIPQQQKNVKLNQAPTFTINNIKSYTTYSFTTPSNVQITEFVYNNQVFAVTWHGPVKTNVKQLLGEYFGNINTSPITSSVHQAAVSDSEIQYSSGGYPGAFYGSALLKSQLPTGFSFKDTK